MKTLMKLEDLKTVSQLTEFLTGTQAVAFSVLSDKDERYRWIGGELIRFRYMTLGKREKGVVVRYLMKVSGYSRQQMTRLIAQYRKSGRIERQQRTVRGFATKYTARDIQLLVEMDKRHDTPCGHRIKKLCERAYEIYGEAEYANLASISISHLYNLRGSSAYLRQRRSFQKTQSKPSSIGERRKPRPDGKPGYLRIDTVHQGDLDKTKGVYHVNAVDETTQFEVVCTVEKISEAYLLPALEELLEAFPFKVIGFHSDNGSEYVNRKVAELLRKLHVEMTKSRSRQTNDNALVEGKNGSVVRKQFGYSHIAQRWAERINDFNREHLNPYNNYHRPCLFPETYIDDKGKQRKRYLYNNMMTPYEKFTLLPDNKQYLKSGLTFEELDERVQEKSDNQAADELQKARQDLFRTIHEKENVG
jgi:transposase InsO family protein